MNAPSPPGNPSPSGGRFRFGLLSLLIAITLVSVACALLGNLLRGGNTGLYTGLFVLLAAAAPMGLMIGISVAKWIAAARRR